MGDDQAIIRFTALGHETRLAAVRMLARNPKGMPASEIADGLGVLRSAMSNHLRILSQAGIVVGSRSGRTITYSIADGALEAIAIFTAQLLRHP